MKKKKKRMPKNEAWNKTRLRLPDLDQAKTAVLNSLRSPESQRGYKHAIDEFIAWYCSEPRLSFNKAVVTRVWPTMRAGGISIRCHKGGFEPDAEMRSKADNRRLSAQRASSS